MKSKQIQIYECEWDTLKIRERCRVQLQHRLSGSNPETAATGCASFSAVRCPFSGSLSISLEVEMSNFFNFVFFFFIFYKLDGKVLIMKPKIRGNACHDGGFCLPKIFISNESINKPNDDQR